MSYRGIPAGYEDEEDDNLDFMMYSTQNLKITVVPDITTAAGLDGQNFDSKLSVDMDNWFDEFRETYNKCKLRKDNKDNSCKAKRKSRLLTLHTSADNKMDFKLDCLHKIKSKLELFEFCYRFNFLE